MLLDTYGWLLSCFNALMSCFVPVVMIGFEVTTTEVTEGEFDSVFLTVRVVNGGLRRNAVVSVTTEDGVAIGVCVCACVHLLVSVICSQSVVCVRVHVYDIMKGVI